MKRNRYKKDQRKWKKWLVYGLFPITLFNYFPSNKTEQNLSSSCVVETSKPKKSLLEEMVDETYVNMTNTEGKKKYVSKAVKRINAIEGLIKKYAKMYNIEDYVDVMKALAFKETKGLHYGLITKKVNDKFVWSYEPDKISRGVSGEIGIYQIMPKNAEWLKVNPYDLEENVKGGIKLFSIYLKRFNYNLPLALNAYNLGPGRMNKIVAKTKSEDFVEYMNKVQDPGLKKRLKSYVLEVLAARKLFK